MVLKRITEGVVSDDSQTKRWRMTIATARMALENGEYRQAETQLARAHEMAKELPEHSFALNATEIGRAIVLLATDRVKEAKQSLERVIRTLEAHSDAAHKELLAVALRFHAQALNDLNDVQGAEEDYKKSAKMLSDLGLDGRIQLAYTLCDLGGFYATQQRYGDVEPHILKAMQIFSEVLGSDSAAYTRADMIYEFSRPMNEGARIEEVPDAIQKMEYVFGHKHPAIRRTLHRYFEALSRKGDSGKIKDAEERFGVTFKPAKK